MGKFTFEEVHEAYIKLKTYIYYDSTNLFMRKQLAIFESNLSDDTDINSIYNLYKRNYNVLSASNQSNNYINKLYVFTEALNTFNKQPDYFKYFLSNVSPKILPKKFNNEFENSNIISNKRIADHYNIERFSVFIDAPIEIHLISVLWILRFGCILENTLHSNCLGNRLIINKDNGKVVKGSGLFKKYHGQYQKWRDDSVNVARQHLNNEEDILILNLDIKDFFHSVRIPKDDLFLSNVKERGSITYYDNILLTIFDIIHSDYSNTIATEYKIPYNFYNELIDDEGSIIYYILPIGLLSSFILANYYLNQFDDNILKKIRPIYYGRYVDDILMVINNPIIPEHEKSKIKDKNKYDFNIYKKYINKSSIEKDEQLLDENDFSKLNDVEIFVINNFLPVISLIKKANGESINDGNDNLTKYLKLDGFKSLYCQSDKTLLYYFNKDESSLVIDKLKRDLEERSSEFRNYLDHDNLEDFDKKAYHLLYDGTEGKIRTLKDYKEDRFGLSVYLTKRIFNALRRYDKISKEEAIKLIKFFQGYNTLKFYTLWERVFTFLLVNEKPFEYIKFFLNCKKAIDLTKHSKKDNEYKDDLYEFLDSASNVSLALNPNFLSKIKKNKLLFTSFIRNLCQDSNYFQNKYTNNSFPDSKNIYNISNLLRHHYTAQTLISFNIKENNEQTNYTSLSLPFKNYKIDKEILHSSPRRIKFWECCLAVFFENISKFNPENVKNDIVNINNLDIGLPGHYFLDDAFDYYVAGNKNHFKLSMIDDDVKKDIFTREARKIDDGQRNDLVMQHITLPNFFKLKEPKIAVANTKVFNENIKASIRNKPNINGSRFNTLSKVFNQSVEENVDIVLFPECFVPIELLDRIAWFAVNEQKMVVTGLEHKTINGYSFNFIVTILPFEKEGVKDAVIVYRLKNHYSHEEKLIINSNHFKVPIPKFYEYDLFHWKGIYFSTYYCFELANVLHRSIFKSKIDLLIACEWNPDINYFSNIVESISRDLHVFVAQVNTSQYGDTRITRPSKTEKKDIVRLKGGDNDTILVGSIDISAIREFQRELYLTTKDDKTFKPLPPDFELENVLKRINNKELL